MPHRSLRAPWLAPLALLVVASILLTGRGLRAQETRPLADVVGGVVAGLEDVAVSALQVEDTYFTGAIPAMAPAGGDAPRVAGFTTTADGGWVIVIRWTDRFTIPDYAPSTAHGPLADLAFMDARLVLSPGGTAPDTVQAPADVAGITGATVVLDGEARLEGSVELTGAAAELVGLLGLAPGPLPVVGTLPPAVFAGGLSADTLASALAASTRLVVAVPAAALAAAAAPLAGTRLSAVEIDVAGSGGVLGISLGGSLTLSGGASLAVAVSPDHTREGGARLDVSGDVTVAELTGLALPGLSELSVSGLHLTAAGLAGDLTFRDEPFHVALFAAEGTTSPGIALLGSDLGLATVFPVLRDTPLAELTLHSVGLVVTPSDGKKGPAPEPVKEVTGDDGMELEPGLNLVSVASAAGALGDLLDAVHAPTSGLRLGGTLDPAIFSDVSPAELADLASRIQVDVTVPLDGVKIPAAPSFVTLSGPRLRIASGDGAITAAVAASTRLALPGEPPLDFDATLTLGREDGHEFLAVGGSSKQSWPKPFGIDWLELDSPRLDARFGTLTDVAVHGRTSFGSVRDLDVTARIEVSGGTVTDAGIDAMGANIPLSAVPFLGGLTGMDQVVMRDVTISTASIAGRAKLGTLPAVDAVLFRAEQPQPGWTLALMMDSLGLADVIPGLPPVPLLESVKVDGLAVVVSQHDVHQDMTTLPLAARERLTRIFGSTPTARVSQGAGLLASFDPGDLDPATKNALSGMGLGDERLVLGGTVAGLLPGDESDLSFTLEAELAEVALPPTGRYLGLPETLGGSFYLSLLSLEDVRLGVSAEATSVIPTRLDETGRVADTLGLDTRIYVEVATETGVRAGTRGTTTSPWSRAFGIDGLTLLPGTTLDLSIDSESEVLIDVVGNGVVGTKHVVLSGGASFVVGDGVPIPDRAELTGQIDTLSLADVVGLANAFVTIGGRPPLKVDYPDVTLTDVAVGFASPGMTVVVPRVGTDETLTLAGPGAMVGGELWLFYRDAPLGELEGKIDGAGLRARGDVHDFALAGFAMRGDSLDVVAGTDPADPPHFRIHGNATVSGVTSDVRVDAEVTRFTFETGEAVGTGGFSYDFGVYYVGPSTLGPEALAELDLGVDAELDLEAIQKYLAGPGTDAAGQGLQAVTAVSDSLNARLSDFRAAVEAAGDSIDHYRALARQDQRDRDQKLQDAKDAVARTHDALSALNDEEDAAQKRASASCNQMKKVCVTFFGTRSCTHSPDVLAQTRCEGVKEAAKTELLGLPDLIDSADDAYRKAERALTTLQQGNDLGSPDDDPRVVSWTGVRDNARDILEGDSAALADLSKAADVGRRALSVLGGATDGVRLERGHVQGSFQQWLAGHPVILDVSYRVAGQERVTRVPFDPTDPAYTEGYLELLALEAVWLALDADPDAPARVTAVFQQRYLDKLEATQTEVDAVNALNNVLPPGGDGEGE